MGYFIEPVGGPGLMPGSQIIFLSCGWPLTWPMIVIVHVLYVPRHGNQGTGVSHVLSKEPRSVP